MFSSRAGRLLAGGELTGKYPEIATSLALLAMTIFIQGGSAAAGRCATRNDSEASIPFAAIGRTAAETAIRSTVANDGSVG
jgi:hypothetical protein